MVNSLSHVLRSANHERRRPMKAVALALLALVMTAPSALAAPIGIPIAGNLDPADPLGLILLLAMAVAIVATIAARWYGRNAPGAIKRLIKPGHGLGVLGALIVVSAVIMPGGALNGVFASAPGASAGSGEVDYFTQTDTTFTVRAQYDNAAIESAVVYAYLASDKLTDEQIYEQLVNSKFSCTTDADGQCKVTAMDGGVYDVLITKSGFYPTLVRNQDNRIERTAAATASVGAKSFPTMTLRDLGTIDTAKNTASALGWSAGTTNTYTIFYVNSESDAYVVAPAVKFVPKVTDAAKTSNKNVTFSSVSAGQDCFAKTIDGTTWIVWKNEIGPSGTATCAVKLTYAAASASGAFDMVFEDLFQWYAGPEDIVTASAVNNIASSTKAVTV